ncbi:flavin-dependent oxidoreductase [Limnohabitans sp. TS-CS-82]|uniref:flavin-dependent oxidoreductase n=1 Tax=Limnohabitans sp. TS-CS-82 TaxID=2094193 RepID=UPI000CF20404|nr:flavin-dependent oxidoreductase [Limnohabitans sp. TS-CS-82]PQA80971.1 flavin-dependent oxidoreductase [Limnohabitans sp. TS-CS-82]
MKVAIIGGGIAGLGLALGLHERGIACDVYESVPEVKEMGVGITLLPHATKELAALGVLPQLEAVAIENLESVFYNRYGQYIYKELRGRHDGYATPELGIHRGKLHRILFDEVVKRLGTEHVHTGHRCIRVDQTEQHATVTFELASGGTHQVQADVAVACDGVNSTVRKQFFPDDKVCFAGINTWRGVTVHKPILTGKSYMRVGSIDTGKMVIYPIVDNVDGQGNQLINWMAEIQRPDTKMNDWNKAGDARDCIDIFKDWKFPWLDVPHLILSAERVFEYPMVDKDALPQWSFGRITLMGDAAHPMYPRGSNGSAQGLIDARTLADLLSKTTDVVAALQQYQDLRLPTTAKIVQTNRTVPPDAIIMKADALSHGQPFGHIDDLISQAELRQISDNYKQVAGFAAKS